MAPDKLIRIEVGGVAGKEMQGQAPLRVRHVLFDHGFLMRRQAIDDQMQRFLAAIHQLLEQIDKQFTGQPAFIGSKPERPFGIDRRGGADTLALPGSIDHRRLAALCPSLAMHRIGAKAGLVPEVDFRHLCLGLLRNGGERIAYSTRSTA